MAGAERVVIAGGSGFVGHALTARLAVEGRAATLICRQAFPSPAPGIDVAPWTALGEALEGAAAVVNLAGEGMAARRWNARRKAQLRGSRVATTERIVAALGTCARPPGFLLNASATGYYGAREGAPLDESALPGSGFLAETCVAWEGAARSAEGFGIRVVRLRMGVVLGRDGGALPRMAWPVRCFVGTPLGSGAQGFPWIHVDDLVAMILAILGDPEWTGAVNAVAPEACSQAAFTRGLGKALRRPILPVPCAWSALALRVLFGEMAEEMLLAGAFVTPAAALQRGFAFRFPTVDQALRDLLGPS